MYSFALLYILTLGRTLPLWIKAILAYIISYHIII